MNKDIIYIEPDDDITNVITKIENAKGKIVAIMLPDKAEVFRSIVNMKLIIKAGEKAAKTLVLVTTEPTIIKLAAVLRVPVTKDLQTAPAIPKPEDSSIETVSEEPIKAEKKIKIEDAFEKDDKKTEGEDDKKEDDDEDKKGGKAPKKSDKNAFLRWLKKYKMMLIFSGVAAVALAGFLVWAFIFAPSATITVEIRTAKNNFSENINFTSKLADENTGEGRFFLEEKTSEITEEKSVTATGKKNLGEKASGKITVQAYFKEKDSIEIKAGTNFTINDLVFVLDEDIELTWDGEDTSECKNSDLDRMKLGKCLILNDQVKVTASENGTKYNIAASTSGWKTNDSRIEVKSESEMTGGTDKMVTVIQQSDIDKIIEKLSTNDKESKEKLLALISETSMPIESSFKSEITKIAVMPEIGQEIKENVKPTVKITITSKIYALDKTKIEEFISSKAKLGEGYKIYSIDNPFIENFMESTTGYVGKLKTSYTTGAKITENEIVEKVRGKGLGDAQHDLKNVEGISSIKIDTSFPWVNSIPNDTNKIFVDLIVK